jgi:GxxExxY protein
MSEADLEHSQLTRLIIAEFFYVYNKLGYGYLESVYVAGMTHRLERAGLVVEREFPVAVELDGVVIAHHRLDLVVNKAVVIEIKSTATLHPVFRRQLHNYLRSTRLEVGLLLHFGPDPRFQRMFVPNRRPSTDGTPKPEPSEVLV